jgi:hypothetical protein
LAFGATAALAVTLNRPAQAPAAMTTASHAQSFPRCTTARLAVSLAPVAQAGSGASEYPVEFTNTSATPCTLTGYPQVTAYATRGGAYAQVGNVAAQVESATAHRVLLRPGATAHSDVDLSVAGLPPRACKKVTAAGLRVIAPGESAPRYLRHEVTACSLQGPRAPAYLHVRAVQPGKAPSPYPPRP